MSVLRYEYTSILQKLQGDAGQGRCISDHDYNALIRNVNITSSLTKIVIALHMKRVLVRGHLL